MDQNSGIVASFPSISMSFFIPNVIRVSTGFKDWKKGWEVCAWMFFAGCLWSKWSINLGKLLFDSKVWRRTWSKCEASTAHGLSRTILSFPTVLHADRTKADAGKRSSEKCRPRLRANLSLWLILESTNQTESFTMLAYGSPHNDFLLVLSTSNQFIFILYAPIHILN